MSDRLDMREFLAGYLAEADDLVRGAHASLLGVDEAARAGKLQPRAVRDLYRGLHTLKGLSGMVGAPPIVDLTHEMESVLRAADRAGGRVPASAVDVLLQGLKVIEQRLAALGRGDALAPAPPGLLDALRGLHVDADDEPAALRLELPPDLAGKLSAAEANELLVAAATGQRVVRVDFRPGPELAARGVTITSVRERLGALGSIAKVVPISVPRTERAPGGLCFALLLATAASDEALAEAAAAEPGDLRPITVREREPDRAASDDEPTVSGRRGFVRVDVERLDDALTRLSALIVTRFKLENAVAAISAGQAPAHSLVPIVAETSRHLRDLRQAIMRARLVSVAEVVERAPLIVRGASRASGKLVRVRLELTPAEVDKDVGDQLMTAVVHLLRNAVDHGIESADERRASGKPDEGTIVIGCREQGTSELELTVSDDGRGIDRDRLARTAGASRPDGDTELLALMARPGVSTAERATHTSGRGLGMDIVQRVIVGELGGDLRVTSVPGRGTTFTLRVPLTVTIVEVFSFECAGERFVVPVSAVDDLAEVDPASLVSPPEPRGEGVPLRLLSHRGRVVPLVDLAGTLGLGGATPGRHKAIIVRLDGDQPHAFEVDRMLGRQEVVVRPVLDPLATAPGVAGSTDLGDGRPTLVLDLATLARRRGADGAEVAA